MNPITRLQFKVWAIDSAVARRAAACAVFACVMVPAWLAMWLITPALFLMLPLWRAVAGVIEGLRESVTCTLNSVLAEPREWRERCRVFGVLWRESRAEYKARGGLS